jgi:hypothetical protein
VGVRSELLEASQILETAALDPYEFVRDAYLQRRRNQVYDGNPPEDADPDSDKDKPRSLGPSVMPDSVAADDTQTSMATVLTATSQQPSTMGAPNQTRVLRLWLPAGSN